MNVEVPPAADGQSEYNHDGQGTPLAAHGGTAEGEVADYEGKEEGVERHRAFAHDGEPGEKSGPQELSPRAWPFGDGAGKVVDAAHHEGVAVDVPRGGAPHEYDVVAGAEEQRRHERVKTQNAAREPPEVVDQEQCGKSCHGALECHVVGRHNLRDGCGPCGQRRFFEAERAVHGRDDPVSVVDHLAGRDNVARLHNVGHENLVVHKKCDQADQHREGNLEFRVSVGYLHS